MPTTGSVIRMAGPATVRRCLEELTRDYLDATDEITIWRETAQKG